MLEKVKVLKDNNGVETVKKFTPPSPPPLNHVSRGGGGNVFQGGGGKKNSTRAISTPLPNITPPLEVFLDPPLNFLTSKC